MVYEQRSFVVLTNSGRYNPFVVIRIDANRVAFEIERKLTVLDVLQFVLVEIRPAPYASINHMWEALAASNLVSMKHVFVTNLQP